MMMMMMLMLTVIIMSIQCQLNLRLLSGLTQDSELCLHHGGLR